MKRYTLSSMPVDKRVVILPCNVSRNVSLVFKGNEINYLRC